MLDNFYFIRQYFLISKTQINHMCAIHVIFLEMVVDFRGKVQSNLKLILRMLCLAFLEIEGVMDSSHSEDNLLYHD